MKKTLHFAASLFLFIPTLILTQPIVQTRSVVGTASFIRFRWRRLFLFMVLLFCGFLSIQAQNLIINHSAEITPFVGNGWTQISGNWQQRTSNPSPQDGMAYFLAGSNVSAELQQDIDVSASAACIDAGCCQYDFSGYVRSFPQTPMDEAQIIVEYLGAGNVVLDFYDSGLQNNTAMWMLLSDSRLAPIGTRTIRVRLFSFRQAGSSNDGYIDNLSLVETQNCSPTSDDAGVFSLDAPTIFCTGSEDIVLTIANFGNNQISTVNIDWEVNGMAQSQVVYNTPIDSVGSGNSKAQIILGNQIFSTGQNYTIKAWTSSPNGVIDNQMSNDTLEVTIFSGLEGTYTIGGASPDFVDFNEAMDAIYQLGICGHVTFNVRNGTYNEQISISEVPGMDFNNTITFQSESGDSSLVVLTFGANSTDNFTVQLNGADYFRFKNLTLEATNTTYGRVIDIREEATNNHFENCELRGVSVSTTSDTRAVVYSPDNNELDEYNIFQNNYLRNGSFGFWWWGDNDFDLERGNIFDNNRIENPYYIGIYLYYQDAVKVRDNEVATTSTYTSSYGILTWYCDNNSQYLRNNVTGWRYGIRLENADGTITDKIQVYNNFVQTVGTNDRQGIYTGSGSNQQFFYNSVQVHNTHANSEAFYTTSGSNKEVLNNIFANYGGGYAIWRNSTNGMSQCDFNNLYTSGANLGNWNGARATLSDWQNASSLDANSISVDPYFLSSDDYPISNISLDASANPIPQVTDDIEGELRNALMPDIGADEFTPSSLDAGVVQVLSPTIPFAPGVQNIAAVIKNFGSTTLTSLDIEWEHNNIAQTTVNWTGTLAAGDTLAVNLGTLTLPIKQAHEIRAWSTNPNSMADPFAPNDTSEVSGLFAALSGTYTLGGGAPDFIDFAEAATNLNNGGVVGAVIFNVRNGTYNEQFVLNEISGTSEANPVIFQSESADSSAVTLEYDSPSTLNYLIRLNGADWVTIQNMTLRALDGAYGRLIELNNGADNNTIQTNHLIGIPTTNTSDIRTLIFSQSGTNEQYNRILNNHLENGDNGVYFYGLSINTPEYGNIVSGNIITNTYEMGIYVTYQNSFVANDNEITMTSTYSTQRPIYLVESDGPQRIIGNQIIAERGYLLNITQCNGTAAAPAIIANNFITSLNSGTPNYGISNTSSSYQQYYHNSINIEAASDRCMSVGSSSSNITLLNNVFKATGGGYAIYNTSPTYIVQSDYNDFYTTGTNLAYWSGNRADLAAWQVASGMDANSLSVDPLFVTSTNLHITNNALDKAGTPISEVTDDIDSESRDPAQPDIGADEIITDALDASVFSIESPTKPFPTGNQAVWIRILNNGSNLLTSADVEWEVNNIAQTTYNWTGSLASGETSDSINIGMFNFLALTNYTVKAWTANPNAGTDEENANDTLSVNNLYPALAGVYTIGGASPDFVDFAEAKDALDMGGVAGAVTFNVRNGTYNEQVSFPEITGAGATNTVTFQSESGDSTDVTLTFSANSSDNYTVQLNGADWFIFRNMTIEGTQTTYARVLDLRNSANHTLVENCELRGVLTTSTGTTRAVVFADDHNFSDEFNVFQNCYVRNGSYGFFLEGDETSILESGNVIQNCVIENTYYRGIYIEKQNAIKVLNNTLTTTSNYTDSRGITLSSADFNIQVNYNQITGFDWGILLSSCDGTATNHQEIYNNFVQTSGTANAHSIYTSTCNYQDFYHNTVRQLSTNVSAAAFFATGSNNKVAYNNIFSNEGGGYAVYRSNQTALTTSDYNGFYSTGTHIAFDYTGAQETMSDWQATTGFDSHSFGGNPYFLTTDGYTLGQVSLNATGTDLGLTEDIEGQTRNTPPDIGCYEFDPPTVDAGIVNIIPPSAPFAPGNQTVLADLKNFGTSDLTSATIEWTVNGVLQTPVNWTGTITSGNSESIVLGMFNFAINQDHLIEVYSSLPNGGADIFMENDSTSKNEIYAALSGTYTIGGASPDFDFFAEAASNLNFGGILDAVIFNVRTGTYNEQFILNEIPGTNAMNTITYQSESGDSTDVVLTYDSNSSANFVVYLNGTDWIRFQNMTLEATNTTYGRVLDLSSGATNNRVENCELRGVSTTSTATSRAVIYAANGLSILDNNNVILNNLITNGSYGIYSDGVQTQVQETGWIIENNHIINPYRYGMYIRYNEEMSIRNNRIVTNSTYTSSRGIEISSCYDNIEISGNKIIGFQNVGIYPVSVSPDADKPLLVANNFIYMAGSSTSYGILTNSGSYHKYYYNTVHQTSTSTSSYAIYFTGANKEFKNNIFSNSGNGFAYYRQSGTPDSDYNNLYTTGANLAFWGSNQATLADWQTASGVDANSLSVNPIFIAADSFAVAQASLNLAGTPLSEITIDIEGEIRDMLHPDIGCDEFSPPADDAGISLIVPPATPFVAGNQMVRAVVKNFGTEILSSAIINWTVNGTLQTAIPWAGSLVEGDTMEVDLHLFNFGINQAYEIAAWTTMPNGVADDQILNDSSLVADVYVGLAGIYTLGGTSPDFNTFAEAATNLKLGGVVGATTFEVRDGTYNEQVIFEEAPGADTLNTITFQSESGDSSTVILTYAASNSTLFYTCQLNGADWMRFENMTMEATGPTYGIVLDIRNSANHNRIENCEFRGISPTSTSTNRIVINNSDAGNVDEYNVFLNNYVKDGSYGFWMAGDHGSNLEKGNRLENNVVENSYYRGIFTIYQDAVIVHNNLVMTNSTNTSSRGIWIDQSHNNVQVTKNRVFGFYDNGIFIEDCNSTAGNELLVANNFVQLVGTTAGEGIYSNDGQHHQIYHNTVEVLSTNTGATAFYSWAGSNKHILNNIFSNTGGGYAFNRQSSNGIVTSDHNDLYVTGASLGNWGGTLAADLAAWQVTSGYDANSVSLDPIFVGGTDLHVTNVALDKVGTPVAEVTDDIDGEPRNPTNPDCGADEFITAQNDASVVAISGPMMPFAADIQSVYVSILNNGLDTLTSTTIDWEVNGVAQPTFAFADTLLSSETADSVCIGTFQFEIGTEYLISVWSSLPNGMADEDIANDTTTVSGLYASLGGIYTIGGTNPDFNNFTEALDALLLGGVVAPVTFNVRDGIYTEQLTIPEIMWADATNTITFQSESGDSSAVKMTYNSNTNTDNFTLQLDGADWFRFKNMTLENTSAGSYGRVVDIQNGAMNNQFSNNEIIGISNTSTSTNYALIYSGGSQDHYNIFANNRLLNGSYAFYYLSTNTTTLEAGTIIEGNHSEGQYGDGMYVFYQDAPIIRSNTILTSNTVSNFDAIYCNYCDNDYQIVKNVINMAVGSFAIAIENCDGTSDARGLIANNFVELSGTSTGYGIWVQNVKYQNIYHNNVNINSTPTGSRAYYQNGTNSNVNILNNIFVNSSGGYTFYNNNGSNIESSDFNDLYTTGSNIGYWSGSNYADLAAWQAGTSLDPNSISVDPVYTSSTDLHVEDPSLNNTATPVSEVTDDIDGEPRSATTPDIGADEFAPISFNDAGIIAITYPNKITPFAEGSQPVEVVIRNNGSDTIQTANIEWYINGVAQMTYAWSGFLEPGDRDTVTIGNYNFGFKVAHDIQAFSSLPNGVMDSQMFNDSTTVLDLYTALDGIYTIGGVFPDFFNFAEAANVLTSGGMLGAVTFNARNGTYNEQMSLGEVSGASPTNTITFQSESGMNTLVTLTNSIASPDYTVQLNGTDYVTFQNMTLGADHISYTTIVEIGNEATNLNFINNRFIAPAFANDDLVESVGNSLDNNLTFEGNYFEGGKYAIELNGINSGSLESGVVVENNTFISQRDGAISMIYMNAPAIRSNMIDGTGSTTTFYGLFLRYCDNGIEVLKNKISNSEDYGMYFDRCDATAGTRGLIANNFVHTTGSSVTDGIYFTNCNFQNLYYNNVHNASSHISGRAFYITSGGNNNVLNNIFSSTQGGYSIYAASTGGLAGSNHNDLHSTGVNLGYWAGTNVANLAAWQAISGKDNNSVSANPLFFSDTDLHVLQVALDSAATSVTSVTDDIDGDTRNGTHADIGADEFDFLENDLGIIAILSPNNACDLGNMETVKVVIQNYGGFAQTGFDVAFAANGSAPTIENVGGLIVEPGDTAHYTFLATANLTLYTTHTIDAETQLAGDENAANDSFTKMVLNTQTPTLVTNMLPADGSNDVDKPINFSWFPSTGATRYDLFFWHDTLPMPATPIAPDLTQINYIYNHASLVFGDTYKWQVVAKNDFCESAGPIQTLTLRQLPELEVAMVSAPGSPFSGQDISVSWQVDNNGSGTTGMTSWIDAIYLSQDNVFTLGTDTYLGGISNLTALNQGQMYANNTTVTLPNGVQGTYYIFVWSDRYNAVIEGDNSNNATISNAMSVNLTPPPDLQVTSVIAPMNQFSGQPMNVTWTVSNEGIGDMETTTTWRDRIYISDSEVFNVGTATFLEQHLQSAQLNVGENLMRTESVNVPQGIFGDYWIHITTDFFNNVFEHAFESNNTGTSDTINVILTPPPDLIVHSIIVPDSVSNRENATLSWTVENNGGSITTGSWSDRVYISTHPVYHPDSVTTIGTFSRPTNLNVGETFTQNRNVTIPATSSGTNYFYVFTDYSDNVFEYTNENNNIGSAASSTFVKNADLIVSTVSAPANTNSGTTITVNWTVKNKGFGDLISTNRNDKIYISTNAVLDMMTATELASINYTTSIPAYSSLAKNTTVMLPNGISGSHFIHVLTDVNNNIYESNEANNDNNAATTVMLTPWPDLQIDTLMGIPDTTIAGSLIPLTHVVKNFGAGNVQSNGWNDKIYISANPVWTPSQAVLLRTLDVLQAAPAGGSYSLTTNFNIPMLGNNQGAGVCYLYVYTDQTDKIFEHTDEGNNVKRSNPIIVFAPTPVDLDVLNATTLPDTLNSGQNVNLQWMVKNLGSSTGLWEYDLWYDGVYLSTNNVWDEYTDLFVKDFTQSGPVGTNETYADNQFFNLPNGVSGDYHIFLASDHTEITQDGDETNNVWRVNPQSNPTGAGPIKTIHIKLSPSPDLQVNTFVAPSAGDAGQPISVSWTVTNNGTAATTSSWTDKIYLSTDFNIDNNDPIIGTKTRSMPLAVSASYTETMDVFLPSNSSGNYILIFQTDAQDVIFEAGGENNNTFLSYITVTQAPPSDLVVSSMNFSNMAMVGEPFQIDYTTQNQGANPAAGVMKELLYFSEDSIFDASDIRFTDTPINRNINLAPSGSVMNSVTANVPGMSLGDYFIIAQTDILDNIVEDNDTNNVSISAVKVTVAVKELLLGIPITDTLEDNQNLYCRIEVHDTLENETMLLTLDALPTNSVNELYLSFGEIPSRSNHDYSFNEPFAPDQEIVVPELEKGTYYLLGYGSTISGNSEQEIDLHAQIIPFSIRDVQANQGGNTGNVTVKIEGAKFTSDMEVRLEDGLLGTIVATNITLINSAEAFVTFPLSGAALGLYDIVAEKPLETTMLADAFSVVAGGAGTTTGTGSGANGFFCNITNIGTSQNLASSIINPSAVRVNRLVPITIQFGNAGNVDIPCPYRFLQSMRGAPLSFIPYEFDDNLQQLYLVFEEPGGPPGILRPGSSASITVYAFSSAPLRFVMTE